MSAPTSVYEITPPGPHDAAAIEALLDAAFGPGRQTKTSYRFRDGVPAVDALARVAREQGRIVGSIAFWPLVVDGGQGARTEGLLLGPLAVDPNRQGVGIGGGLMHETITAARRLGHRIVFLVGDYGYYRRFGFRPATPEGVHMPGEKPERLLVSELVVGGLSGVSGALVPAPKKVRRAA